MDEKRKVNLIVNAVVRPIVLLLIFVAVFSLTSGILNRDDAGEVVEMKACTFPTVTTIYKGREINRMYGYAEAEDSDGIRGAASLLDENHKLTVRIHTYGTKVNGISYEVRSLDMERLIENTKVEDFQAQEDTIDVQLNIQDLLEDGKEYQLIVKLDTQADSDICYYTRIRKDGAYYAKESLDFVLDFHNKTCDKQSSDQIVKYLESSTIGDNSSFAHVNIRSSYDMVTWGDLDVKSRDNMDVTILEINNQTAMISLDYTATLENSAGETEHYDVEEYYRVRYTQERMYLLDFDRTMDQYFEIDNEVVYSTAVQLGITDSDVDYKEAPGGKIVSFVQKGELFSYNSSEHSLAKVFGFWEKDGDPRYCNDQHAIRIISVDEQGNTDFVVYGYMNRGIHEGKVGISVCHYNSITNSTEEYIFIEYDKSYELLKEEVEQLAYVNGEGYFYVYLQKNLYQIDVTSRHVKVLAKAIGQDGFAVSEDHSSLVIQTSDGLIDSTELVYMNLKTGATKKLSCQEGERICPMGFIGDDFIYGIAHSEDVFIDGDGQTVFPSYKVVVESSKGEVKKTYEPSGIYVLNYTIKDNILQMERAVKTSETHGYSMVDDDQIIHSDGNQKQNVVLESIATDRKKKEYQLEFGFSLASGEKKRLKPKEVLLENVNNIRLERVEEEENVYYVYCKGKLDGVYFSATEAVQRADEEAGVVVNSNQEYVWERIMRQREQRIEGIETISTDGGYSSLQASLLAILRYNGNGTDPAQFLAEGMSPYRILQQELGSENVVNLTNTSLDKVLYCIDRGYPVLAATGPDSYVVLTGYNELNTIVMNPAKGTNGYVGMNDSRSMFENGGNIFIACIPNK